MDIWDVRGCDASDYGQVNLFVFIFRTRCKIESERGKKGDRT